ncbi:MAG: hypothetical protein Q8L15_09365 [Methylobacter sp.]|nr:hypothetical protein [Methylobacter sp.]
MNSKTKENILALEIFEPGSQTGYGINAMLLNSSELLEVPKSEIVATLTSMEQDGLISCENEYYRSTRLGKIARQTLLSQQGIVAKAITNQRQHALEDLILAIAASEHVEFSFGTGTVQKSAIEVYLHDFPETEINIALEILVNSGRIENDEFSFLQDSIYITGDGLQYYQMEVRERLNLNRGEGILKISLPPRTRQSIFTVRFRSIFYRKSPESLVGNERLRELWRLFSIHNSSWKCPRGVTVSSS